MHHAVDGGEAESGALPDRLRGVERLPDTRHHLGRHAAARIAHLELHANEVAHLCRAHLHREITAGGHRIARIDREVHQHLLELQGIDSHSGKWIIDTHREPYGRAEQWREETRKSADELSDVHCARFDDAAAREGQQLLGELAGPCRGTLDLGQVRETRIVLGHRVCDDASVADHGGHEVVEVVRDATCEPPDGLEAPGLGLGGFVLPSVRHVAHGLARADDLAAGIAHGTVGDLVLFARPVGFTNHSRDGEALAFERPLPVGERRLGVAREPNVRLLHRHALRDGYPREPREFLYPCWVRGDDHHLAIDGRDEIGRALDDRRELRVRGARPRLRGGALGECDGEDHRRSGK